MCFIFDGILTIHERVYILQIAIAFIFILVMLSSVPNVKSENIIECLNEAAYFNSDDGVNMRVIILGMINPEEIALVS